MPHYVGCVPSPWAVREAACVWWVVKERGAACGVIWRVGLRRSAGRLRASLPTRSQLFRPAVQVLFHAVSFLLGVVLFGALHIFDAVTHQVVQDSGQLVGRRRDRFGRTHARALPSQIRTQITLRAHQAPDAAPTLPHEPPHTNSLSPPLGLRHFV